MESATKIPEEPQKETVDLMTSHQIGSLRGFPFYGDGFGYGFGVLTKRGKAKGDKARSKASVGSYSWAGFFNTYFCVDPENELIAILMTQRYPHKISLREDFRSTVYRAITSQ